MRNISVRRAPIAVVDAAARWLNEPDGEEYAYALLGAVADGWSSSPNAEATASTITPPSPAGSRFPASRAASCTLNWNAASSARPAC